jgi:16S rRNA (guanine966-N2)-methyltransferase
MVCGRTCGQVRIIAGRFRGRTLAVADIPGLRPSGDRVRETLFNWLQPVISGARCLDLFAGSGALGLEAASRGASEVLMVDQSPRVVQRLRENVELLDAHQVRVVQADGVQWLTQRGTPYDIVFLDPPFASDLLGRSCRLLEQQGWLGREARVYLESAAVQPLPTLPETWRQLRSKKAGRVRYVLAQSMTPSGD